VGDGHLNLHTRLNADRGDLLDHIGGRVQVDETLVDPHLKAVEGVGTLTGGSLARGNAQHLCRHADRALHLKLLFLSTLDQVSADLLQVLHVLRSQGDADAVHLGSLRLHASLLNTGLGCHLYELGRESDAPKRPVT
ncbi:hypothetical protein Vretifemale_18529, partial [Volvox reticuliferus]